MFNGTTIDDLIRVVEDAEAHMRSHAAEAVCVVMPRVEIYPAYSTYAYQWAALERAAGAA